MRSGWREIETVLSSIPDDRWLAELAPERSAASLLDVPDVTEIELSVDGQAPAAWFELTEVIGSRVAVARDEESEGAAGPLLFLDAKHVTRPEPNLDAGKPASVLVRDNWILVSERGRGTRPRLYNALGARTAFSSDEHWSTTLWPR